MEQNYLLIQNNVVENIVVWDGGTDWTPPSDATMLSLADTPSLVWELNVDKTAYELTKVIGVGSIGFTWDGNILTTNLPQPAIPVQPLVSGMPTV